MDQDFDPDPELRSLGRGALIQLTSGIAGTIQPSPAIT
jgi:hypothetical protein